MAMRTCPHCGLKRAQMREVLKDARLIRSNGDRRYFSLVACPDCAGLVVLEHSPTDSIPVVLRTWPEDAERALDVQHLPPDVARYYAAARKVLDAGVPDGAAVQLRRTLEAAAAHHGKTDKVLVRRIEGLIADGLVTKPFAEAMTLIRKVGNQGAHATDEDVDQETAERALRFTTQLLRNLFEVPGELSAARLGAPTEPEGAPAEDAG